jgi:hypothetical protein
MYLGLGLVTGALAGAIGYLLISRLQCHAASSASAFAEPTTLRTLLAAEPATLGKLDIGFINLLCAEGLPGVAQMSPKPALATLDEWAKRAASETERHFYKFRQCPADFNNSEAYFRILTLVTVLQQDCRVRYNPARIHAPDFANAGDLFLPGLLAEPRQGTCLSLPVLYVAVGRRLGYPLKLVTSKAHLFARWESADGKERLNIEATNEGLNCFPDEYYHTWPVPLTAAEVISGQYLKSLTPAEELAVFLSARGHCLEAAGRLAEAQLAHAQAHVLAPRTPVYLAFLASAVRQEMPDWERVQIDLGSSGTSNRVSLRR